MPALAGVVRRDAESGYRYGQEIFGELAAIAQHAMKRWHCRALNHDGAQTIDVGFRDCRRMCVRCNDIIPGTELDPGWTIDASLPWTDEAPF